MRTARDVEAYLERMNRRYQVVEGHEGTYLVDSGSSMPATAVHVDPPLVVMRVHVADIDRGQPARVALYERLLELNTEALVHTSFGLEGSRVVLTSALELANLDFNELEAVLDEIDLTLAQQVPQLAKLQKGNA